MQPTAMWVILRLLTAVIAGVVRFWWRRTRVQETGTSGGCEWVLHCRRNKGRVRATSFGVPFKHSLFLRLTREGALDRFFKAIGVSRELQTGDDAFDREIYIACDHPAVEPVLRGDPAARDAVRTLFARGIDRIYSDGVYLWAYRGDDERPDDNAIAALAGLRDAFAAEPAQILDGLRDPFFVKALVVQSLAWSIAFYGVPGFFEYGSQPHPRYFEWGTLIGYGLAAAVMVWLGLLWLAWLVLRGSSRTHRIFVESALILAIGVPISTVQLVADANSSLDRSAPVAIEPMVVSKYLTTTTHRGSRRTHYHLVLEAPGDAPWPISRRIETARWIYVRAQERRPLRILMHPGALRIPWVERIEPE